MNSQSSSTCDWKHFTSGLPLFNYSEYSSFEMLPQHFQTIYYLAINNLIPIQSYTDYINSLTEERKIEYFTILKSNLQKNDEYLTILSNSININEIIPESITHLMSLEYGISSYKIIVKKAIEAENYDILWFMINLEPDASYEGSKDYFRTVTVMKNANEKNYYKLLELLYSYYLNISHEKGRYIIDEEFVIPIWLYLPTKLEYVIRFIIKFYNVSAKEILDYYLKEHYHKFNYTEYDGERDMRNFYNAFLEAGVPLSYFQEIQDINETIPIWLSTIKEDI